MRVFFFALLINLSVCLELIPHCFIYCNFIVHFKISQKYIILISIFKSILSILYESYLNIILENSCKIITKLTSVRIILFANTDKQINGSQRESPEMRKSILCLRKERTI